MNNWSIFVNTQSLNLYQKFAGEIRFGPEYIELKSEPEIVELNNNIFGNWFYRTEHGIFLQKWNSLKDANCSLIFINYEKFKYQIIEENIKSVFWEMKVDNDCYYLNLNYNFLQLKIHKNEII